MNTAATNTAATTGAANARATARRVAGAPISWGVCEVPGWGHQLAPDRVLDEMTSVGLSATEFGPDEFLPPEPQERARTLRDHGLEAVGGFVPVVLHDPDHDPLPEVEQALQRFVAANAAVLVLAAATGLDGYDARPELDETGWRTLLGNLDRLADHAATRGVLATLHPHVGTMVETEQDVRRVLDGASIGLCLDTGHLMIGGTDPVALAVEAADRIVHVHLKDVDAQLVERVRAGHINYTDAVRSGIYRPLGQGDVDITRIVEQLDGAGYEGWFVLEQDTILGGESDGAAALDDVRASLAFLRSLP
jgi:inosose dehydratase